MKKVALVIALIVIVVAGYLMVSKRVGPVTSLKTSTTTTEALTVKSETATASTTEYSVDTEYPQFGIPAFDAAIKKDVLGAQQELVQQAKTDKPAENDFPSRYEFDASYDTVYISPTIVSVKLTLYTYTGGAHGMPVVIGENFDRTKNALVTLDDVVAMTGLTLPQIAAQAKAKIQHDDPDMTDDATFGSGFDPKPENYQTFVIGTSTVTFIFQPYQVAAYAAGTPEASFPRK